MRRALVTILLLVVAACGGEPVPTGSVAPGGALKVVTTSTVFADLIRNVGGDRVAVTSLVPRGVDVHTYQATPVDLRRRGRGRSVRDERARAGRLAREDDPRRPSGAPILKLGVDLEGAVLLPGDTLAAQNPHLWMDVAYATLYATQIAQRLQEMDTIHAAQIAATSTAYVQKLADLDVWVREQIGTIPAADRQFVMFHDALPYFARAYGLTIVGVAVEAPGQDPSAGEIANLIDAIKATGVRAIFSERQFPTALVDQIARETGATVVANLYNDTLGDDPVTSYEALIRWDVEQLVGALR